MAWPQRRPTPGQAKRVSVMTEPPSSAPGQTGSEQEPGAGQLEDGGQPLEHEPHGRFAVTQRIPEVAPQRALEEAQVLHGYGIVKPHGLAELGEVFGGGVGRQQQERRVARQMEDEEDDGRDPEEHQTRLPAAAQQVRLHTVLGHSAGGFAPLPKPPPANRSRRHRRRSNLGSIAFLGQAARLARRVCRGGRPPRYAAYGETCRPAGPTAGDAHPAPARPRRARASRGYTRRTRGGGERAAGA